MDNDRPPASNSGLTEVQDQAASWVDGALLLLAGPGSGKTRVLTTRIARLLAEGAGWRVLALTFTNRAADEMRSRVVELVPDAESRLFIGTFHSFAAEVLRQSGTHIGIDTDFKIYTAQSDRLILLKEALRGASIETQMEPAKLLPIIDRLRDRLAPPDECHGLFADAEVGEMVANAYAAFNDHLLRSNVVDVGGLIYWAHRLFVKYPAIAKRYRTTYRFLCVDEFQDTNGAQYALLKAFAGDSYKNVMVVADDDQIIYQWNGAHHRRIEQFVADFDPEKLQLPTNFRCPAEVVELANRLVSHNRFRAAWKRPLLAAREIGPDSGVRVIKSADETHEAQWIARDIGGRNFRRFGDVVVIARTKALLEGVQAALGAAGIKAQIAQRRDSFASVPYIWLHAALSVVDRRNDENVFSLFVDSGNRLMGLKLEASTLVALAKAEHGDLIKAWVREAQVHVGAAPFTVKLIEAISSYVNESIEFKRFVSSVERVFHDEQPRLEGEFASYEEDVRAWSELVKEISYVVGPDAGVERFLQELEMRSKEPPLQANVVPLLTIHGSKGNEFDHVYLAGLAEDVLPSFQSKKAGDDSAQMEEERRNCFVAITRTRSTLTLTYAERYRGWRKQPSRFLHEMGLV